MAAVCAWRARGEEVEAEEGELMLERSVGRGAALEGARSVTRKHLVAIAPSALRHRLRRDVLDETGSTARITRAITELFG
jgi:magnesium chelatase subunit I